MKNTKKVVRMIISPRPLKIRNKKKDDNIIKNWF